MGVLAVQLPWLRPLWLTLRNDLAQQRLSHAHCIAWQPELGSDRLIQQFSRLLLCQQPQQQACGRCKSCLLAAAGNHPDYYLLDSVDDKAIGVEAIRDLTSHLQHTSNQFGGKVVWINQADKMTPTAANALLKTLEEPTADTYFILSPRRVSSLLPTLRSRMQVHVIACPERATLVRWLAQQLERNPTSKELELLQQYPQAPVQVLNWIQTNELPIDRISVLADAWFNQQRWPDLERGDWSSWLDASEQLLHDLLRMQQGLGVEHLRYPNLLAMAKPWLAQQGLSAGQFSQWLKSCYATRKMATEQSGLNGALLVQSLWARWR
jgi:DNA polymerase-3 subunit delta'